MTTARLTPHLDNDDCVILFDGVCKLCNAWSNFIIHNDQKRIFKLCSVQSSEGQDILAHFGLATDFFETMLYVEHGEFYGKSNAFFKIVTKLDYPWRAMGVFSYIPKPVRDWLYDRIALNRYRLFGKYDFCTLPSADHKQRFIEADG